MRSSIAEGRANVENAKTLQKRRRFYNERTTNLHSALRQACERARACNRCMADVAEWRNFLVAGAQN
jgi:hypothetical protein